MRTTNPVLNAKTFANVQRVAGVPTMTLEGTINRTAFLLFFLVAIGLQAFAGVHIGMLHEGTPLGIAFSLFVITIASLNLVLDFDFIEQGIEQGAPKQMEWYAAFGLIVTLIWLYVAILRLLSKLRNQIGRAHV